MRKSEGTPSGGKRRKFGRGMGILLAAVLVFNTLSLGGLEVSASEIQEVSPECETGGGVSGGDHVEDIGLCAHHQEHTENCGYGEEGSCAYECRLCPIEDLTAALPRTVTEDNAEEVRAQLDNILALYRELTADEQEQIDISCCLELQEALDKANASALVAEGTPDLELFGQKVRDGDSGNGWSYANGVLTLDNFHSDNSSENFIHITNASLEFILYLRGDNSVKTSGTLFYGNAFGSTTITGDQGATLSLNGQNWNDRNAIIRNVNVDVTTQGMIFLSYNMVIDNATVNINMNGSNGYIYTTHGGLTVQNGSNVTISNLSGAADYCVATNGIEITDSILNITNPSGFGVYVTEISSNVPEHKAVITNSTISANVLIAGIHCEDEASITNSQVTNSGQFLIRSKKAITVDGSSTMKGITYEYFNSSTGTAYLVYGDSTLAADLTVAADSSFVIPEGATLMIPAGVALTNNGTMYIHDKASLTGAGPLAGDGDFLIDVCEDMITGTEGLTYTGTDYTDQIKLEGTITLCGVEFTADTEGWMRSIQPEVVKNAGDYTVTFTKNDESISKAFTVAECPHTGLEYKPLADNKHGGTCPVCGEEVSEEHTWVDDTCPVCNSKAVAKVETSDGTIVYLSESDFINVFDDRKYNNVTVTLLSDIQPGSIDMGDIQARVHIFNTCILDLAGHTITSSDTAIYVWPTGNLTIKDSSSGKTGQVVSTGGTAILTQTGMVSLIGGTYTGNSAIDGKNSSTNVSSLLANYGTQTTPHYAYFDAQGNPIALEENQRELTGTVTVKECEHTGVSSTPNNDGTHSINCPYCGYTEAAENCSYGTEYRHDDTYHWQTCTVCGYENKEAHSWEFVYDQTGNVTENFWECFDCGRTKDHLTLTITVPTGLTYGNTEGKKVTYTLSPESMCDEVKWYFTDDGLPELADGVLPAGLPVGDHWFRVEGVMEDGTFVFSGSDKVTISPASLTAEMVEPIASMTYSGAEQKPAITVKQGDTVLTEGTDYDVTYNTADFTNAGTITVTITGKGNYTGTVEKTYTIEKALLAITASNQTITYGGSITQGTGDVNAAGLCSGDRLDGITLTASTANVPGGTIIPSAAAIKNSSGEDVTGNYAITYQTGVLTIGRAEGTLTVPETSISKNFWDGEFSLNCSTNGDGAISYTVSDSRDVTGASTGDTSIITVTPDGKVQIKGAGSAEITVSLAEGTNHTGGAEETVTVMVAKAAAPAIINETRNYTYTTGSKGTVTIEVAEKLPDDRGETEYTVATADDNGILSNVSVDENGRLVYTVVGNKSIGDTAEVTVTARMANYESADFNVQIELTARKTVELQPGSSISVNGGNIPTYGLSLSDLTWDSVVFVELGTDTIVEGTLAWKDGSIIPEAGTTETEWIFTPEDNDEYIELTGTVKITVAKARPETETPETEAITYNPSVTLDGVGLKGGSAAWTVGGSRVSVAGTWSWQSAGTVPTVDNSGYTAVFTPADTKNYETVTGTVSVTVAKAVPYIAVLPTAAGITYGDTLSASALSGGTIQYGNGAGQAGSAGTFIWKEPDLKPTVADSDKTEYTVIFTPFDAANYEAAECKVTLAVQKAENAPNMPGGAMTATTGIQLALADVSLAAYNGWEWENAQAALPSAAGEVVAAVARYIGEDKDNYENVTREITVTMVEDTHVTIIPDKENDTRVVLYAGIREIPQALADAGFDTEEKILKAMSRVVLQSNGYTEGNMVTYDIELQFTADGGKTWVTATEENFSFGGLTITIPYLEGTSQNGYEFRVVHMFTHAMNDHKPGETEAPAVTNTADGIRFTIDGLSPVTIAWKAAGAASDTPGTGNNGEDNSGTTDPDNDNPGTTDYSSANAVTVNQQTDSVYAPKTGDDRHLCLYILLLIASGVGTVVAVMAAKEKKALHFGRGSL